MPDPALRTAAAADIPALHALVERAYRGDSARAGWTHEAELLGGQRTDATALAAIIADPHQHILLAERVDTLIGCVQLSRKDAGTTYLGLLSVDPGLQASGIGRWLLAAAERDAVATYGARTMEMTVIRQRTRLIEYYARRGYALTGEERPFPYDDIRFGVPTRPDLAFAVLTKPIGG